MTSVVVVMLLMKVVNICHSVDFSVDDSYGDSSESFFLNGDISRRIFCYKCLP